MLQISSSTCLMISLSANSPHFFLKIFLFAYFKHPCLGRPDRNFVKVIGVKKTSSLPIPVKQVTIQKSLTIGLIGD